MSDEIAEAAVVETYVEEMLGDVVEKRAGLEKPEYIEKVAREELGMTRHGEMPYIAPAK